MAKANRKPESKSAAKKPGVLPQGAAKAGKNTASGWQDEILAEVRRLIHEADSEIVEERKWAKASNPSGVPVWSRGGIVCTGETYRQTVKLTFARGASLADPGKLFNASLDGGTRRAIDIRENEQLDGQAFQALIQAAVAENLRMASLKSNSSPKKPAQRRTGASDKKPVKLLSGGNPQIAKADGDAPVQEYIAAMPGWKSDLGRRIDALIERTVPDVRKAVRWNSPFYGSQDQGWFLSFHVLTKYVKVTFFDGLSLKPLPPGGTEKSGNARWIDIYKDDEFDESQLKSWVRQAAALPGWDFGRKS